MLFADSHAAAQSDDTLPDGTATIGGIAANTDGSLDQWPDVFWRLNQPVP
jgi:hypothetical protein